MITQLLLAPITGPIGGLIWIGKKIQEQVDQEVDEKDNLHKRLLSLQLAFDMGEIPEAEFEQQEEELLLAIEELEQLTSDNN
jgi:Gas vesicle protein G